MKIGSAKKIAVLALLTGLALIAFLLESLFVAPAFPAAKPGLSNFFTLFALLLYGLPEALFVVVARTVLGALFAGNLSMLLYSLTAGVVSAIVSRLLLFAFPRVSVVCVSVVSATVHNLVQLGVYCMLTGTAALFLYAPWLCMFGALAGAVVGLAVFFTAKAAPRALLERGNERKTDAEGLH